MYKKVLVLFLFFVFPLNVFALENKELPKLYIYGDINNMQEKSDERKIKVKYVSDSSFDSYAILKVQGASSLRYEKKNYNITFYENSIYKEKKKVDVKWGEMSKYTLKANWIDKTHSRNIVSARIYSSIQEKYGLFNNTLNHGVVDGFPIEIYVNDEFHGLYTLNLHKDYFFDLDENNPNNLLIASKATNRVTNFRAEADINKRGFEVEVGEESQENIDKLNRLIKFVKDSTDEEFVEHFDEYLNFDAMLNYYCYMMFAELVDNTDNNIFLVTYDGKIWYISMYDMDISWGGSNLGRIIPYDTDMHFARNGSALWEKFERNYGDYIAVRYSELRKEILTRENVLKEFDSFYSLIPDEVFIKEQDRWKDIPGSEISQVSEFLDIRIDFVDSEIEKIKTDNYANVYKEFAIDQSIEENKSNLVFFLILGIVIFIVVMIVLMYVRAKIIIKE